MPNHTKPCHTIPKTMPYHAKTWILSLDMKTKLACHVSMINIKHLTHWKINFSHGRLPLAMKYDKPNKWVLSIGMKTKVAWHVPLFQGSMWHELWHFMWCDMTCNMTYKQGTMSTACYFIYWYFQFFSLWQTMSVKLLMYT